MTTTSEVGQRHGRATQTGSRLLSGDCLLAGVSTAALEGGDGPPMVLLHRPASSPSSGYRCSRSWFAPTA